MAKLPVGYRSPFNKISSVKPSPLKIAPLVAAGLIAAAPGLIQAGASLFGRSKRIKEQDAARDEMAAAKKAFMGIDFKNPYAGLQDPMAGVTNPYADMQNPYAGMENPYAENLAEDLTVDTQAADYLRQQQQQSQANIMQGLRGAAGASGAAGLAQSMANIASGQAQKASANIAQQERQNQMARIKGEEAKRQGTYAFDLAQRKGAFDFDKMQRKAGFDIDVARRKSAYETDLLFRQGEAGVAQQEQQRLASLYGLSIDRMNAADAARQQARAQGMAGLGSAASGVAGLFAPGGMGYDALGKKTVLQAPNIDPLTFLEQPNNITMDPFQIKDRPIVTKQPIPTDPIININTNPNPYGIG